ncbi:hypothetical protein PR202_gb06935 [Eleusine coracana subsp. coracana]|uniref:F-box protein AT5G49610-like beta-propeller domain-containing protein n=1 Tax=Eleusine coracana subsp. coracana TaxID=191504 RepID=A0AAV5EAN2_ELECO|nr:hypothetical protein QOZ80_2BG0163850 [Eleusine coracana subsp. coracana]GJN19640.1 hypothetical protein PR202_gb06935 [Eleusine coracana subsp. coracana]
MMMRAETTTTTMTQSSSPESKVLGNGDLVGDILDRVGSPTTLVRAADVSKRLLGFYVTNEFGGLPPEFVPMVPTTEFAAAPALRSPRGPSSGTAVTAVSSIFSFHKTVHGHRSQCQLMVLDTLRDPMPAELPPLPPTLGKYFHAALLPDDNLVAARGDDSLLYLFHVTGYMHMLDVWFRRMDGAGEWVLRDTINLKDTCGHLVEQGSDVVSVVGVGDHAEFVFLELLRVFDNYVLHRIPASRQ